MDHADKADEDAAQGLHRARAAAAPDAVEAGAGGGLWAGSSRNEPAVSDALARDVLYGTAACCACVVPLLIGTLGLQTVTVTLAALFGLLALLAVAAARLPGRGLHAALTGLHIAVVATTLAGGVSLGWNLAVPGLAAVSLLICILTTASGWQAGALLAVVCAGLMGGVAAGWVPGSAPQPPAPPLLRLGVLLVMAAAGLAGGVTLSRRLSRARGATESREQRFRALLALAVDGYWEIDAAYRLTAAADQTGRPLPLNTARGVGVVPWLLQRWHSEADALDLLLAQLDGRQPFRDIAFCWTDRRGRVRHYRASGEPRFNRAGIFTGYWGVIRDITPEQAAQSALAATETRYRELFSHTPTPLVLHRNAVVIDANAAALALLGQPDLRSLVGSDLLAFYESGDSRERARRRLDWLHGQPPGTALPLTDFKLLPPNRQVAVRATSVRVEAEGGPATLAIFVDDTERRAAEEAVRRSETMLTHLVATSPDLITLTDTDTGRYAMVNRSFERYSGWTAAEAFGRTGTELGIWRSVAQRTEFVDRVRREGAVSDLPVDFVNKAGGTFSMRVSAARFVMDQRDYLVINARDVTDKERERLEREAILLNASIGIAMTRQGRYALVNHHFEQMFGCGPGELEGQPIAALPGSLLGSVAPGTAAAAALWRGEPVEMEGAAQRKDGSPFTVRIRGRAIDPQRPQQGGAIWIVEDITERRQFEQALARARDDAESANRAKSAFLANTSHELRTPLNALIGLARLARAADLAPLPRQRYLEQIEQSAQSLAAIISDILDLSRIEAGKLPIEVEPFDLSAELLGLERSGAVLTQGLPLTLRVQLDADVLGRVQGDALRVRQIVNNYLVNAIKFTPEGSIAIRAQRPGGAASPWVRIEVEDTGPGVPAATLAGLFKPFTQADVSTTRRFGGTGLGLSICHELATLMGGRVGADSHEGRGSLFWVELPLPPLPHTRPAAAGPAPGLPAQQPAQGRTLADLRVLVAEDNAVNMMIAVALLEHWGVAVTQAQDGSEAVAAARRAAAAGQPFDAVLMDLQMPVMGGHEATRTLRELEATGAMQNPATVTAAQADGSIPPLPIIALTAAALVTERDEALRAGMNDFLTKPIDSDKLQATLHRWCQRLA